ncbi:MAG: hypothetical protein NXY57DRAFT_869060, partial [Lentinula lateritia]
GRVFCADCLHHITRRTCPLYRAPFDPRSTVNLHTYLDSVKATFTGSGSGGDSPSAEQEAAAVSNAGTSEANLCSLESECKTFLSDHPRSLICIFHDLRVGLRVIAYLCEVKSTSRSQD